MTYLHTFIEGTEAPGDGSIPLRPHRHCADCGVLMHTFDATDREQLDRFLSGKSKCDPRRCIRCCPAEDG